MIGLFGLGALGGCHERSDAVFIGNLLDDSVGHIKGLDLTAGKLIVTVRLGMRVQDVSILVKVVAGRAVLDGALVDGGLPYRLLKVRHFRIDLSVCVLCDLLLERFRPLDKFFGGPDGLSNLCVTLGRGRKADVFLSDDRRLTFLERGWNFDPSNHRTRRRKDAGLVNPLRFARHCLPPIVVYFLRQN